MFCHIDLSSVTFCFYFFPWPHSLKERRDSVEQRQLCDHHFIKIICTSRSQVSCSNMSTVTPRSGSDSLLSPMGSSSRPKSIHNNSLCLKSSTSSVSSLSSKYHKAPGFEREVQWALSLACETETHRQFRLSQSFWINVLVLSYSLFSHCHFIS